MKMWYLDREQYMNLHELGKCSIVFNSWKGRTWLPSLSRQLLQLSFLDLFFVLDILPPLLSALAAFKSQKDIFGSSTWIAIITTLWTSCSMVSKAWMWSVLESQLMATPRINCNRRPKWPGSFSTTWSFSTTKIHVVQAYLDTCGGHNCHITTDLENLKTLTLKSENLLDH